MKPVKCLFLGLIVFSLISSCYPVVFGENILGVNDLPSSVEELTITTDTTLIINKDETAVFEGKIIVQPSATFNIINNGEFTLKTPITIQSNVTIQNNGKLTLQNNSITLSGHAELVLKNSGTCIIDTTYVQVYGGFAYFTNDGVLTASKFGLLDQMDGTSFTNNGEATLTNSSFTANGATGLHNITNNGNLSFHTININANYGGKVYIKNLDGNLILNDCAFYANGASHGQNSSIVITNKDTITFNKPFITNTNSQDLIKGGTFNQVNGGIIQVVNEGQSHDSSAIIEAPMWQQSWFAITIVILLSIVIVLIVIFLFAKKRKR